MTAGNTEMPPHMAMAAPAMPVQAVPAQMGDQTF